MTAQRMPQTESPFSQPLARLTELTLRFPGAVLWGAGLLALLCIVITVSGLEFKTSRLDLLNPESRYNQRWLAYLDEFGNQDDAVIVIRAQDPAAVRGAIDEVAAEVAKHPQLFESILWRRDLSRIKAKGLHLVPPAELAQLAEQLRRAAQGAEAVAPIANPAAALARLNDQLERGGSLSDQQRQVLEQQYAQAAILLLAAASASPSSEVRRADLEQAADSQTAAGIQTLVQGLAHLDPQYLTAEGGRMGFVLLRFAVVEDDFARGGKAIGKLRQIIDQVAERHPLAWLGLTGMPVIEYDEMRTSQWDMLWTNVVSLGGCVLLFIAGYGGIRHAGMATAVLLVGMSWSFAFVTLAVGHLNILSSAFAIVLIGLGIDFGIHYVAHYLKLCGAGVEPATALVRTAAEVGPGVVTSGVTTAAAFFMAGMTQFVGVRELGIIAGGGILLCVVSAIVVLPPLILVCDRDRAFGGVAWGRRRKSNLSGPRQLSIELPKLLPLSHWLRKLHERPAIVLPLAVLATIVALGGVTRLKYDHNLLNLQPSHVESVEIERKIFAHQEDSVWFAVSMCSSRQELRRRKAIFEKLPSVAKTEEIASLIPEPDRRRQDLVAEIHHALLRLFDETLPSTGAGVELAAASHTKTDVAVICRQLTRGAALLNRGLPFESPTAQRLTQAALHLEEVPPEQVAASLAVMSREMQTQLRRGAAPLKPLLALSDPMPPTAGDLPRELADRYIGRTGRHLLKVYARGDIWDMDRLTRFVAEVETVDPLATGHPVQTYYASRHMQFSYIQAGIFALLAVFALLLFDFRSIRYSLLAMVPLAMGFLQMCGLIGWIGIPLNAANLIALPLILGIGVDDGVHLVHEMRRRGGRFRLTDSTAVAVILISTTTMASFGALILARHQGLRSLGQVLTLGSTLCLTCSMLAFPALLTWLTRKLPVLPEEEEEVEHERSGPIDSEILGPIAAEAAPATTEPQPVAEPGNVLEPFAGDTAEVPADEPAMTVEWMSVEALAATPAAEDEPAADASVLDPLARPHSIVPRRRAG
jgi:hopanoid biosynthesis associated RND transporter like protein HpnN